MSGVFTTRVNRNWTKAQADISPAAFFWEWINFLNDHLGISFIGYGTGKSQSGVIPPDEWISWDPTTEVVPYTDNSWVVFQMDNASAKLDGDGSFAWQAKLQMTLATGFDDCNVADVDYGRETNIYCVNGRASAAGGWNSTTLDFTPAGGEEASDNFEIFGGGIWGSFYSKNENYFLDIIANDDVIFWKGSAYDSTEALKQSRGGYLGMTQRRNDCVPYPFLFMAGGITDLGAGNNEVAINGCGGNTAYQWERVSVSYWYWDMAWPSYTLWGDGTKVSTHKMNVWDNNSMALMDPDTATGDSFSPGIMIWQQESPDKYAIIGELLMVVSTGKVRNQHDIFGSTTEKYIEICYQTTGNGGVAMRWPTGIVPIW